MAFKARISAITCWPAPPPKIDPTGQQRTLTEAKIKEDAPPAQLYDLKTDPYSSP